MAKGEAGINQRVVVIEFDSIAKALAAHDLLDMLCASARVSVSQEEKPGRCYCRTCLERVNDERAKMGGARFGDGYKDIG